VLVIAVRILTSQTSMIMVLIVDVMRLMTVVLTLEAFMHIHLVILVAGTAVEKAMILAMIRVVVHAERIVRGRVSAGRSVRRGCIGVLLE